MTRLIRCRACHARGKQTYHSAERQWPLQCLKHFDMPEIDYKAEFLARATAGTIKIVEAARAAIGE
jgi:hypothetical protein